METTTKICSKCKVEKSVDEFSKKCKRWLLSRCKECIRIRRKELYNMPNSLYKQRVQIEKKKYYAKIDNYYKANKEKIKEQSKKYKQTEKGKIVRKNSRHKRRAKYQQGDVTTQQLKTLIKDSKKCYWCNCNIDKNNYHIDHITPLSKGGLHTIYNLVVSCPSCNLQKGSKDPFNFAIEKGKLF